MPFKNLILEKAKELISDFPELKKIESKDLRTTLKINGKPIDYEIKCDGAFCFKNKRVFFELKGYGDNTNDVLSAITASQLLIEIPKYKNSRSYYIGNGSAKKGNEGVMMRDHFPLAKRKLIPKSQETNSLKAWGL